MSRLPPVVPDLCSRADCGLGLARIVAVAGEMTLPPAGVDGARGEAAAETAAEEETGARGDADAGRGDAGWRAAIMSAAEPGASLGALRSAAG